MIAFRSIGGRRIACWVGGEDLPPEGGTLVFVHGAGGDHRTWIRQYQALRDRFPLAAVDLPGHGRSEGPGEEEVSVYAQWLRESLAAFGIVRPILIGHSLGAGICLEFAVRYGGEAAAVVLAGGGARMPVSAAFSETLQTDPAAWLALAGRLALAKANRERFAGIVTEGMSRTDPATLRGDFAACSRMELTGQVQGIRIPACVICGTEDRIAPPALSQFLGKQIPGARLVMIEGAGHFVMLEAPGAFNGALTDFATTLSRGPGSDRETFERRSSSVTQEAGGHNRLD